MSIITSVRLKEELHEQVSEIAKEDERSVNYILVKQLERLVEERSRKPKKATKQAATIALEWFEDSFWPAYPKGRKPSKKEALRIWKKIFKEPDQELFDKIMMGLSDQKMIREIKAKNNEFYPEWKLCTTWLNQECWDEEIDLTESPSTNKLTNKNINNAQVWLDSKRIN